MIQPWGTAPTPLIPKSVLGLIGDQRAPAKVIEFFDREITLSEVNSEIWEHTDSVDKKFLAEIVNVVRPKINKIGRLELHTDKYKAELLALLPLSPRTERAVRRFPHRFDNENLTFDQLITIQDVGIRSAIEFACVLEAATTDPDFVSLMSQRAKSRKKLKRKPAVATRRSKKSLNTFGTILELSTSDEDAVTKLLSTALSSMDDRMLSIAEERLLALDSVTTLEEIGKRYDLTKERIRQIEVKAGEKIEAIGNPVYAPVVRITRDIRKQLGSAFIYNEALIDERISWAVSSFQRGSRIQRVAKLLLLHLAGPYKRVGEWLLVHTDLYDQTYAALMRYRNPRGGIVSEDIVKIFNQLNIREEFHKLWLAQFPLLKVTDYEYIFCDGTLIDKSRSVLTYFGRAMSAQDISTVIGHDSAKSLQNRLSQDPGFWRVNVQSEFVIAGTRGYFEYSSIVDSIVQEIEFGAGKVHIDYLIGELGRKYGIRKKSIISFTTTPLFVRDKDGYISIRQNYDSLRIDTDLSKVASCYRTSDGTWCWRVEIDKNIMRGSGRTIPKAFAQELGCDIGETIEIDAEHDKIIVSWPLTSVNGSFIGSLRNVAMGYEGGLGDYLIVYATKPNAQIKILHQKTLDSQRSPLLKLALMLGYLDCDTELEALRAVETALELESKPASDRLILAQEMLMNRGETDLVELLAARHSN